MRFNKENLNNLRNQIKILDVISNFLELKKKGQNYLCLCPFHDDKHASLTINDNKNIFKCFSCGVSGDAFSFVAKFKNINYYEAALVSAKLVGIDDKTIDGLVKFNDEQARYLNFYNINNQTNIFFKKFMNSTEGEKAKQYLLGRSFTIDEIKQFEIGWAPNNNIIFDLLTNKDNISSGKITYNYYDLEQIGLVNKKNNQIDFFFKNRITFPIYDENNNIVGFSGRLINDDNEQAKYLNSLENIIFHKNEILFNLNEAIKDVNIETLYIVEGFMDAIAFRRLGINNVVATMGTSFSKKHLDLLISRLPNLKIINLCFDNDDAGIKAIESILKIIQNKYIIYLVNFNNDKYKDIDEILQVNRQEAIDTINNLISLEQYMIDKLLVKYSPLNEANQILILDKATRILNNSKNELVLNKLTTYLANKLNINEDLIIKKLNIKEKSRTSQNKEKKFHYNVDIELNDIHKVRKVKEVQIDDLEQSILQFIVADRSALDFFDRQRFKVEDNEIILNAIMSYYNNHPEQTCITMKNVKDILDDEYLIGKLVNIVHIVELKKIKLSQEALLQTIDTYTTRLGKDWKQKQLQKIRNSNNPSTVIEETIKFNNKIRSKNKK